MTSALPKIPPRAQLVVRDSTSASPPPDAPFSPARRKLTSVEAQRLVNAVDDCASRLEAASLIGGVAGVVDADPTSRLTKALGSRLTQALRGTSSLIRAFEERIRVVDEMFERQKRSGRDLFQWHEGEGDGGEDKDGVTTGRWQIALLRQTELRLRGEVRNATRRCRNGDGIVGLLKRIEAERGGESGRGGPLRSRLVQRVVDETRRLGDLLRKKLANSPMDDEERHQTLREASIRDKKNNSIVDRLERELASAGRHHDAEVRRRNDVIRRLQIEINAVEKTHEENVRRTRLEAEKQENADMRTSETKKQKLLHEIAQLKAQLTTITAEHRESEVSLRKRRFKVETEVENIIQKFDEEIDEKHQELEQLSVAAADEKLQLERTEAQFEKMQEKYLTIMEDRRKEKERKEAEEKREEARRKAAVVIQAKWRSFRCRKLLLRSKKMKKGKTISPKK